MSDSEYDLNFDYDEDSDSNVSFESIEEYRDETPDVLNYKGWTLANFIKSLFIDKAVNLKERQLPQCSLEELMIMLIYLDWEIDEVINKFYDGKTKLYEECGLVENGRTTLKRVENFDCSICCEKHESVLVYSLPCDHTFCVNCYREYICNSLYKGSLIRCMATGCNLSIPHTDVDMLFRKSYERNSVTVPLDKNVLLVSAARFYIASHKLNAKWCPSPDCDDLVQIIGEYDHSLYVNSSEIDNVPVVKCPDDHEFCYECQYENHLPCPCWIVKLWLKKCKDDSETINWIEANTQACPNCFSLIQKNGGCNHMSCSECKFEFCWICGNSWEGHGNSYYECNRYDPDKFKEQKRHKETKKRSVTRYLHFYKRFTVHQSSMTNDQKTLERINQKMKNYMDTMSKQNKKLISWTEVQFLHDAVKALSSGRKTLKWTYCFAFYLGDTNFSEIFEQNQNFLNQSVEKLSEIIETMNNKKNENTIEIVEKYKSEVRNLSKSISTRQSSLIKGAASELRSGLLYFDT